MNVERADVVVVGASPAGLAAARTAAEGGADVLLCEARDEIGEPPSPANVVVDLLWPGSQPPPSSRSTLRRYAGIRLLSPGGAAIPVDVPGMLLDRARFDRDLWWRAEDEGARLITGVKFTRARAGRLEGDGTRVEGRLLLFADGADSLARRFLRPVMHPGRRVQGVAYRATWPVGRNGDRVDISVGGHAPWGRAQLNPGPDAGAGAFWLFHGPGFPDLKSARRIHARALGIPPDHLTVESVGAGWDPVLTLPRELAGDGVLVAGGAGGQAGVEMGLAAGAMAGEFAGEAIRRGDVSRRLLSCYERAWKTRYQEGFQAYARGFARLNRMEDAGLDDLMGAWGERVLEPRFLLDLAHPRSWRRWRAILQCALHHPAVAGRVARLSA